MLTVAERDAALAEGNCPVCGGPLTLYPASKIACLPARVQCIFVGHYAVAVA